MSYQTSPESAYCAQTLESRAFGTFIGVLFTYPSKLQWTERPTILADDNLTNTGSVLLSELRLGELYLHLLCVCLLAQLGVWWSVFAALSIAACR